MHNQKVLAVERDCVSYGISVDNGDGKIDEVLGLQVHGKGKHIIVEGEEEGEDALGSPFLLFWFVDSSLSHVSSEKAGNRRYQMGQETYIRDGIDGGVVI